ncbi:helix-turn-helix domain-containing protein [Xanthomonas sp. AM6]|uniref:helix-turn-helix domain-containing protein n=1 Tax=Xanthomonas sp. AM6 TaxID=2982531 RepID=UPI0021DAF954|nr:helix-turn-helix transcriptional regulator [Xanthomonas sp. AM6]UYB51186.1 helix-turn-helix domain-containing protein [Xanthomonas sp. AM6]
MNGTKATTVGDRIVEAREAKEMSRPELAKLAKVKYPTLAGLENGDQVTSTQLPALAAVLGVTALWLATGKEPRYAEASEPDDPGQLVTPAALDPRLLSRTHTFLAADHPYDLTDPGEAALFASAYEWLAQQDEATDSPQSFTKFLRWAAMRNLTAPKAPTGDKPKGSAAMSRWRNSLNEFANTDLELSQEPKKGAKLSTK